jgi:hypothetical protein
VHALIRNAKLPREFSLRDASSMSSTDNNISFASGQGWIRQRGDSIQLGEQVLYGGIDGSPGWTVLGPNSPLKSLKGPIDGRNQLIFAQGVATIIHCYKPVKNLQLLVAVFCHVFSRPTPRKRPELLRPDSLIPTKPGQRNRTSDVSGCFDTEH